MTTTGQLHYLTPHCGLRIVEVGGDDRNPSLWHTINVIQENAMKGGLHGRRFEANGQSRRATTKLITGIDQTVQFNVALWHLGEETAREATGRELIAA